MKQPSINSAMKAALVNVLEPLVRLAMEERIGVGDLANLIELACVRSIEREASEAGQPPPADSDIEVRTGIGRHQVGRMRASTSEATLSPTLGQPGTVNVIWGWQNDPKYRDRDGRPRLLRNRGKGSFVQLVRDHGSRDVRAGTILRELARTRTVRRRKDGMLELQSRNDTDVQRRVQGIQELGVVVREIAESLVHNIIDPARARYHRRVVNTHVKAGEVRRLTRDLALQADAFSIGAQDAITDKGVTVKSGELVDTSFLSTHVFICERANHDLLTRSGERKQKNSSANKPKKRYQRAR